jgi:hypothetical protein
MVNRIEMLDIWKTKELQCKINKNWDSLEGESLDQYIGELEACMFHPTDCQGY